MISWGPTGNSMPMPAGQEAASPIAAMILEAGVLILKIWAEAFQTFLRCFSDLDQASALQILILDKILEEAEQERRKDKICSRRWRYL